MIMVRRRAEPDVGLISGDLFGSIIGTGRV